MGFFNNDDKHNNLSIDIFGKKIDDVFTKAGDAIDEASNSDSDTGHKIGSFLYSITNDWEIKIGKKDFSEWLQISLRYPGIMRLRLRPLLEEIYRTLSLQMKIQRNG